VLAVLCCAGPFRQWAIHKDDRATANDSHPRQRYFDGSVCMRVRVSSGLSFACRHAGALPIQHMLARWNRTTRASLSGCAAHVRVFVCVCAHTHTPTGCVNVSDCLHCVCVSDYKQTLAHHTRTCNLQAASRAEQAQMQASRRACEWMGSTSSLSCVITPPLRRR